MRWRWIEISPTPIPLSVLERFLSVAPKKPRLTLRGAAPQSARYDDLRLDEYGGPGEAPPGGYEQAVAWFRRSIEANRNFPDPHFDLAAALAQLGRFDEAHSAVKAGLALNPVYCVSRVRAAWTARSDEPTYLAQIERILEGLRKAGVPEQ